MQSKGSLLLVLAVLAFPIIAISSNHSIFFTVVSIIILILSVKCIYHLIMNKGFTDRESDEELEAEMEELSDVDVKRFGTGLSVAYNMLVILFLFYSSFYLDTLLLKSLASLAILFQIYFIMKKAGKKHPAFNMNDHKPQYLLASVCNILVIFLTVLNKISRLN